MSAPQAPRSDCKHCLRHSEVSSQASEKENPDRVSGRGFFMNRVGSRRRPFAALAAVGREPCSRVVRVACSRYRATVNLGNRVAAGQRDFDHDLVGIGCRLLRFNVRRHTEAKPISAGLAATWLGNGARPIDDRAAATACDIDLRQCRRRIVVLISQIKLIGVAAVQGVTRFS